MAMLRDSSTGEGPPAANGAPTTFHGWPRLPDELKLEVLSHLLTFTEGIYIYRGTPSYDSSMEESHQKRLNDHLFPLIATRNSNLALLAQEAYYKHNVFIVYFWLHFDNITYWPKASCARKIRHMTLCLGLYAGSTMEELLVDCEGARLFRPTRDLRTDAITCPKEKAEATRIAKAIQDHQTTHPHLNNLQTLFIDAFIICRDFPHAESGPKCECCSCLQQSVSLENLISGLELVLQAKKVVAKTETECRFATTNCDEHNRIIINGLAERATKK
ncbi:hypothetical protein COCC4DRAFT_126935 [Bipolaris maydis ATCC 48331]|uniref:Uncharacterized protein n=2 Tax=Cochliobolus heterostrophus TaxID=5016 RepID=M2TG52_COCH5|nr:uncharacterized protein COCC4DRAFT_126935 [Bipolaris maydis ATCC 48331]EMD85479.1 hypothetical protein COCHEDRAFT_1219200 [Bipolaris maydis C5]KAH7555392.1 hypothetical protein BM1_07015 [Bipolaris maydis]EMD90429.1 hypothetical protein COCHEDRAFT_1215422 [Bipolaris maydis C5]ENI09358.1 hypothetical protein COCC4DRAFT_126935 [Bipolaris maydis ATCC 48331]KAJ5023743.1 hypothetical protein J3E73DRAFT_372927 [Bipolaris maydis]